MISVEQAKEKISEQVKKLSVKDLKVESAVGFVLAEDVFSAVNLPMFRQSAMDGYAISIPFQEGENPVFQVVGEIQAGDSELPEFKGENTAIRIYTGAPVPDDAKAIVVQENVKRTEDSMVVSGAAKLGQNIRNIGEHVEKGEQVLSKGDKLNAASIAVLASVGVSSVRIYSKPSIGIVVTGNELMGADAELKLGQIFESNSIMLKSALIELGFSDVTTYRVKDNEQDTIVTLEKALNENDVLLSSGGISVGDYDFVGVALEKLGVESIFYKVNQKPGKPLFFGVKDQKLVFALPGNPSASLTCFYEYVVAALKKMSGEQYSLKLVMAKMKSDYVKKGPRAQFLQCKVTDGEVELFAKQGSHMILSFSRANGLVFIPEDCETVAAGELVQVHMLPR